MSLRQLKKLQNDQFLPNHSDESEESEATPRKAANNFELVNLKFFTHGHVFYRKFLFFLKVVGI